MYLLKSLSLFLSFSLLSSCGNEGQVETNPQPQVKIVQQETTEPLLITSSELRARLSDKTMAAETLRTYFDYNPMSDAATKLVLKKNVVLLDQQLGQGQQFLFEGTWFGDALMWGANQIVDALRVDRYIEALHLIPHRERVVAEGDSWFLHPLVDDVVDHLSQKYAVRSLAAAGDEFSEMFAEYAFKTEVAKQNAKYLVLSGGGNDLLADKLTENLNRYTQDTYGVGVKRHLSAQYYKNMSRILNEYEAVFQDFKKNMPHVRIIVHGYDYVTPAKKGPFIGWYLEDKKIKNPTEQKQLMKLFVDMFNARLKQTSAKYSNVRYVDLRGTVGEDEWYDEIHPTKIGFQKVTQKILAAMQ